ncbi:hypothetical protein TNCV_126501 [Trichonephila clavipes]|nr:hypothetical protein TNCV_126501 [Trichonephila clavipes]
MMGRRMLLPRNVDDLARQLEQISQEITQVTISVLYHSMPIHVEACIQARDKLISRNRGGSERPFFRGRCVQSAITHVLLENFG